MKNRYIPIIIVVLPFLAVLAPALKLVAYNSDYFNLSVIEVVVAAASTSLIIAMPLAVLSMFRPARTVVGGIAVFLFVASVFATFLLPVGLGVIDGGEAVFLELRKEAFYFLLFVMSVFALLLLLVRIFPAIRERTLRGVETLAFAAVLYVAAFMLFTGPSVPVSIPLTGSNESASAPVSLQKNVFILSFDQLQGNIMGAYIHAHPEKAAVFDGFTFYPDAAAVYPNTVYSVSSTLLGRTARNGDENIDYAIRSPESVLAFARESGFAVYTGEYLENELYGCVSCIDVEGGRFNYMGAYELARHAVNIAFGIDIRALGLNLPRSLTGVAGTDLVDHFWQIDLHTFEKITNSITPESPEPTVYFLHFLGTHQPFIYNDDCTLKTPSEIAASQNIGGAEDGMACFVNLTGAFLERLEALAIYDRSLVFVISDHGYELNINEIYAAESGNPDLCRTNAARGDSRNVKPAGSYNPVLFFKDFDSRGALAIDSSPVSLIDIAPTICAAIGCGGDWEGVGLQKQVPANRQRSFWQYFGGGGEGRGKTEFTERFHYGLDKWWKVNHFHGPIYPNLALAMGLTEKAYYRQYAPGEKIFFGLDGNSTIYATRGWSGQEPDFTWTNGEKAEMLFSLTGPLTENAVLRLQAFPYLGGGLSGQEIGVAVNGRPVALWKMTGHGWYEARIPREVRGADRLLNVTFTISHPTSPADVSRSADRRKLGMAVQQMEIVGTAGKDPGVSAQ